MISTTDILTEDGVRLVDGDRAFNYYDMKLGRIDGGFSMAPDLWFTFRHDDGTQSTLNGQRICSLRYARLRGWIT